MLTLLPQPHETIQELKLAITDWIGGYWLGPYALRIPRQVKRSKITPFDGEHGNALKTEDNVLSKGKDGIVIREGERLSEWLEVGDVFRHVQDGTERVLEVVRGEYEPKNPDTLADWRQNHTPSLQLDKQSCDFWN